MTRDEIFKKLQMEVTKVLSVVNICAGVLIPALFIWLLYLVITIEGNLHRVCIGIMA